MDWGRSCNRLQPALCSLGSAQRLLATTENPGPRSTGSSLSFDCRHSTTFRFTFA